MLNRLILKVTKFLLPPPKRLGTLVKNILGGHQPPPPCQIGLISLIQAISGNDQNTSPINQKTTGASLIGQGS